MKTIEIPVNRGLQHKNRLNLIERIDRTDISDRNTTYPINEKNPWN